MTAPKNAARGFFSELKRRRVLRVLGAYLAAAFVGLQGADYLSRALLFPDWVFRLVVILVLSGFVIAMPLAWAFDLGPDGIRRTPPLPATDPSDALRLLRSRWLLPALVLVAAVSATVAGFLLLHGHSAGQSPRRLVVAAFQNRTGDPALEALGEMAADWIIAGLTETGLIPVVDASTTLAIAREPGTEAASIPADAVRLLADETGAGLVVTGRYYRQADSVAFVARVVDAGSGEVLATVGPVLARSSVPIEGADRLRQHLLAELAILLDEPLARFQALQARPPRYEAYQAYITGLKSYLAEMPESYEQLARAFALDTSFDRALLWAAQSALLMGPGGRNLEVYDSLAGLLARRRDRLSPEEQHQFEFQRALRSFDFHAAYSAARLRRDAAPGSDDALREVALSALRIGRLHEGVALLRRLDNDRGLLRGDEYYWRALTQAQHSLGDYAAELRSVEAWAQRFPESPAPDQAMISVLSALGRVEETQQRALTLADRVARDTSGAGMSWLVEGANPAAALDMAARELLAHGHTQAAAGFLHEALARCATRWPTLQNETGFRFSRAKLLGLAGRWQEADSTLAGIDPPPESQATFYTFRAVTAARLGDRARALRISRSLGDVPAVTVINVLTDPVALEFRRAVIAAALGEGDQALRRLHIWRSNGDWDAGLWKVHVEPMLMPYLADPDFKRLLEPDG